MVDGVYAERVRIAPLFLLAFVGCSSAAPSSPADHCAQFYQALCERAVACGLEPNIATCQNVTNANGGYPANCGSAVCKPGLTFDPQASQACINAESSASCADIGGNVLPSACGAVCH